MKKLVSCALICSIILFSVCSCSSNQNKQGETDEVKKFSTTFIEYFDTVSVIVGYEKDESVFNERCDFIEAKLKEYNELFDIYKSYGGINNIKTVNQNAGQQPVKVDVRIIELLEYAKEMYSLTDGKVNVAMGSVLSIWHDYRTRGSNNPANAKLPPIDDLTAASAHTDINDVIINRTDMTVFLKDKDMRLDVGAVAKGYATEQIARQISANGAASYALNIGGNIRTIGVRGDGTPWAAAVTNPDKASGKEYLMNVKLQNQVFVTSGSYERYYTVDGKNYHHIIDPATLMPNDTFSAVSILASDSGLADVLSTALFNMSLEDGMKLIENNDGVEALWITSDYKQYYSSGFKDIITKEY